MHDVAKSVSATTAIIHLIFFIAVETLPRPACFLGAPKTPERNPVAPRSARRYDWHLFFDIRSLCHRASADWQTGNEA